MVCCRLLRIYRAKWRLERAIHVYTKVRDTGTYTKSCWQKCTNCYSQGVKRFFAPTQDLSKVYGLTNRVLTYGFPENLLVRSILLYLALMTVLAFIFLFNVLKFPSDPFFIGLLCGCAGAVTAVLMAQYPFPGCLICVMLPVVVTGTSRTIVILLALSWTIQGPMLNMQENLSQTTKTIACMQEVVGKQSLSLETVGTKLKEAKLKPFLHLSEAFSDVANRTKSILKNIESGVTTLGKGLRRINTWLSNIMHNCNEEVMKPYERCVEEFLKAGRDCDDSVWFMPVLMIFCRAVEQLKYLCKIGMLLQKLCGFKGKLAEKIRSNLVEKLGRRISQAEEELINEYGFNFTMDHVLDYNIEYRTNVSRLYEDLEEQFADVKTTLNTINIIFGYLTLLTCIQLPIGAALYIRRFLNSDNADNYFITDNFRRFDRTLISKGKESALPLMGVERKRYIPRLTLRATSMEIWTRILAPLINVILSGMVVCYWLFLDVSVYTFLHVINSNLKETVTVAMKDKVTTVVTGEGLIARTYQNIMHEMTPEVENPFESISYWTNCIYEPTPPDSLLRLILIALLVYAVISIIFQMYLLRTRSFSSELYYPHRIHPRLSQLHTNILAGRGSWKYFAAKLMQKQLAGAQQNIGHQLTQRMAVQMRSLGGLLRASTGRIKHCTDCNDTGPYEDFQNFKHCENFDCQSAYCVECYFRVPKCLKCKQIKQADDLEIDEEKPASFMTEKEKMEQEKQAKRRVKERKLLEMYSP